MAVNEVYESIAVSLGQLHKRMTRLQGQMLREHNVSVVEYHILMLVMRTHGISQNELAEALEVDKALISRQTRSLEEKGLIVCRCDPNCRRQNILTLTEKSAELLPKLEDVHRKCLERVFSGFDSRQLSDMQCILKGLVSKV